MSSKFSALPQILAQEGLLRKSAQKAPREFSRTDWMGWSGAERWPDGSNPWIVELDNLSLEESTLSAFDSVVAIADKEGLSLYLTNEDGDEGPAYAKTRPLEPEEAEGALKAIVRHLQGGKMPPGFRKFN